MAGKIRGLFSKIGQLLLGKKPPKLTRPNLVGPRGIAMGSAAERKQRVAEGLSEYTADEIEQWRTLSAAEVNGFLDEEQPLFVHSSNVALLQYFPTEQKLLIEYHGGGTYLYSNISKSEAQEFVTAQSKGSAVWNILRVRGTKYGHKKPYVKIK